MFVIILVYYVVAYFDKSIEIKLECKKENILQGVVVKETIFVDKTKIYKIIRYR